MAGTNNKIAGGGFHHVSMRVKDLEKSIKFYCDGLGFVEKVSWGEAPNRTVLLDTGDGNYFEISQGDPNAEQQPGIFQHIALRTEDCEKATEAARKAGAEITVEPKEIELQSVPQPLKIKISFFKGPDGEVVEFFEDDIT
ncbi:VOC family protein [Candidatus Poribacteria bacterium]|nr:VOC family protein [Candidatus Poribacteria bacterium]